MLRCILTIHRTHIQGIIPSLMNYRISIDVYSLADVICFSVNASRDMTSIFYLLLTNTSVFLMKLLILKYLT